MSGLDLTALMSDRARVVAGAPSQALLELARHVREAAPLVVLAADPQADRALDDPRAAFDALIGEGDGATRVIGPASGGLAHGAGDVLFVSAIGPLAPRLAQAIGPALGLAVDLGHAWDVAAHELVAAALALSVPPATIGLALPPEAWPALAPALRTAQGRAAIVGCARGETAAALVTYGVVCVPDLGALARALSVPRADRPRGRRVAVVTGTSPLAALVVPAFADAGLVLAEPSRATIEQLAGELPQATRFTPIVQIPGATERHAELARDALATDLRIDHVFAFDLPGLPARDPALEAAHLATLAALTEAAAAPSSPLLDATPAHAPSDADDLRAEALVAAAQLMRKTTLGRDETIAVLAALHPALRSAPALRVASLAHARQAAKTLGYPVREASDPTPIADEAALVARWESHLAGLSPSETPYDRRAPDPFAARSLVRVPARTATLAYRAHPLPVVTLGSHIAGARGHVGLPAREAELAADPALAPAFVALSRLAARLPEVAALELEVALDGAVLALVDARLTLGDAGAQAR